MSEPPRIALYTHDTYGLGHVRRCLRFLRRLSEASPDAALLLVTGSPALHVFQNLPPRVDVVKIPTMARTGDPARRPPHLPLPPDEITRLRQALLRETLRGFAPDVFLVDNFPLGSRRELLPVLEDLRRTPTRTVLGLRDILDAPEVIRREWAAQGLYDSLSRLYDRILVYGSREVMDVASAYALPVAAAEKVRYTGYVTDGRVEAEGAVEAARALGLPVGFLLGTGGGGGDGFPLLECFLRAYDLLPPTPALILTGPLMSPADRAALLALAGRHPHLLVREYVPDLHRLLPAAGVVVSMCGYNTAVEILSQGVRAIVVPRTWRYGEHVRGDAAGREWEQLLRARALARLGLVAMIEPGELTPDLLAESIRIRQAAPLPSVTSLDLGGADTVARHLLELAGTERGTHAGA